MPEFVPDDDPSDDVDGEDGLDATKVDVDPALFGEWPDGEIEIVDEESGTGVVSVRAQHEWEREALIVDMTGACPYCDGEVEKRTMSSPDGDTIVRRHCLYCDEAWVSNKDKGFTGSV